VRYVLIDRITALEPGRALRAIKNVSLSDGLVTRVRPGVSALPASMVLEAMALAAGLLVRSTIEMPVQPVLAKVQPFTAYADAIAGDQIELHAELQDLRTEGARARVTATVGGQTIADAVIFLGLMPLDGEDVDERVALMRERLEDTFPGWFERTAAVGR
jgi:3-hydroxymyristoyl/3-hydroxydecanoyl-(acyl carrier protein) dehydratase